MPDERADANSPVPERLLLPLQPGRYRDFVRIGQGGMGIVYEALDTVLQRRVAIKVVRTGRGLPSDTPGSPTQLTPPAAPEDIDAFEDLKARFLREATVTGGMEHPGVIPVYELGETESGVPYYTMRFVRGNRTFRTALQEAGDLQQRLALLEPFLKVCDTLAYAHEQGVVHRDLKPENVALGEFGEVVVLDWGLAKIDASRGSTGFSPGSRHPSSPGSLETLPGAMGTPGYIAPEALGEGAAFADPPIDIYALGVMLYEILVGHLPLETADLTAYFGRLVREDPVPPALIDATIPHALSELCVAALRRDRERRTASAAELAAGIRAWERASERDREVEQCIAEGHAAMQAALGMQGFAMLAPLEQASAVLSRAMEIKPDDDRVLELLRRTRQLRDAAIRERERAGRRRLLRRVGITALAVSLIAAVLLAAVLDARREEAEALRALAHVAAIEARAAEAQAQRHLADSYANAAQRYLREGRPAAGLVAAARALTVERTGDGWMALGAAALRGMPGSRALGPGFSASSLVFSPDGKQLVAGGEFGTIRIWDVRRGQTVFDLQGHGGSVTALSVSADGQRLVSGATDRTLRIWNLTNGTPEATLLGHRGAVASVALSPDGRLLASAGTTGSVRIWDLATAETIARFASPVSAASGTQVAWAGRELLTAGADGQVRAWDTSAAPKSRLVHQADSALIALRVTQDGLRCAVACASGQVRLLEVASGAVLAGEDLDTHLRSLVMDAAGRAWAAAQDGSLRVWKTPWFAAASERHPGHGGGLRALAVAPDGQRLCAAAEDLSLLLWDAGAPVPTPFAGLIGHTRSITSLAMRRDGRLVSAGSDGAVCTWDLSRWRIDRRLRMEGGPPIHALALAGDDSLCFVQVGERIDALDPETGAIVRTMKRDCTDPAPFALSPHGDLLCAAGPEGAIHCFDPRTGALLRTLRSHTRSITALLLSEDGRRLWSAAEDRRLLEWDLTSDQDPSEFPERPEVAIALAYSSVTARLASADRKGIIRIWDLVTRTRRTVETLVGHEGVVAALAFSRDGRYLHSCGDTLRTWEPETGRLLARLDGHEGRIHCVLVGLDGVSLYTGGADSSVRAWSSAAAGPVRSFTAPGTTLGPVVLSGDGKQLHAGAGDGTVQAWDLQGGTAIAPLGLGAADVASGVEWLLEARRGAVLLAATRDQRLVLWETGTGRTLAAIKGLPDLPTALAISPDARRAYAAFAMGVEPEAEVTIGVFDLTTNRQLRVLKGHRDPVRALAVSEDGLALYSGSEDATIRVWDVETGRPVRLLRGHAIGVHALVIQPGQGRLLSAGDDRRIITWDVATGARLGELPGVGPLALSDDARLLAAGAESEAPAGSARSSIRLWDLGSQQMLAEIPAPPGGLASLCLSADGARLCASGGHGSAAAGGGVQVWDLPWFLMSPPHRLMMIEEHTGLMLRGFELRLGPSSGWAAYPPASFDTGPRERPWSR